MPINRKWPLNTLIEAMRAFPLKNRRRITIEYVLLAGINDSLEDARRLVDLLRDIPTKINVLPLNEHDRTEFSTPSEDHVRRFVGELARRGVTAIRRKTRGSQLSVSLRA